jgi:hypothetical protein
MIVTQRIRDHVILANVKNASPSEAILMNKATRINSLDGP